MLLSFSLFLCLSLCLSLSIINHLQGIFMLATSIRIYVLACLPICRTFPLKHGRQNEEISALSHCHCVYFYCGFLAFNYAFEMLHMAMGGNDSLVWIVFTNLYIIKQRLHASRSPCFFPFVLPHSISIYFALTFALFLSYFFVVAYHLWCNLYKTEIRVTICYEMKRTNSITMKKCA